MKMTISRAGRWQREQKSVFLERNLLKNIFVLLKKLYSSFRKKYDCFLCHADIHTPGKYYLFLFENKYKLVLVKRRSCTLLDQLRCSKNNGK